MHAPKSKGKPRNKGVSAPAAGAFTNGEVLTLAETAEYLRVTESEVARLVRDQAPSRPEAGRRLAVSQDRFAGMVAVAAEQEGRSADADWRLRG